MQRYVAVGINLQIIQTKNILHTGIPLSNIREYLVFTTNYIAKHRNLAVHSSKLFSDEKNTVGRTTHIASTYE